MGEGRGGNTTNKWSVIPHTNKVRHMVRYHVRNTRKERKRVTARKLVDFLVEREILGISKDVLGKYNCRVFSSSYRATRRWIGKENYKRS